MRQREEEAEGGGGWGLWKKINTKIQDIKLMHLF